LNFNIPNNMASTKAAVNRRLKVKIKRNRKQ